MDKLRAIQYLVAAVEEGSFAGAARRLEVSVPAVQKLLGALERQLGAALLERHPRGVRLTAGGAEYLDCARPMLAQLQAVEEALKHAGSRPGGTLVVAAHEQLAHHIVLPALPLFRAKYPEIQLDLRTVHRLTDADAQAAEVVLLHGWPEGTQDWVHRRLGMTRSLIAAAPDYWARHGVPGDPAELAQHDCLTMRNPAGIVIDLWEFARGAEQRSVRVNGWLLSNAREFIMGAVLRGEGVGRFTALTTHAHLQSGRLVPVLRDWEVLGGPPTNVLYRASARRNPRARLFLDFIQPLMLQAGAEGDGGQPASPDPPAWHPRGYGRASATVRFGGGGQKP